MGKYARYKPRRARARWLEGAPEYVAAVRDSGPNKGADRYTVVYTAPIWNESYPEYYKRIGGDPRTTPARAMSASPFHPQGIGLFIECVPGAHLGRNIKWADLPEDCKRCVIMDGEAS